MDDYSEIVEENSYFNKFKKATMVVFFDKKKNCK